MSIHYINVMKRATAAVLTIAALFTLPGCGGLIHANYRELGVLQPIQTVGIDRAGGVYTLTVSTGKSVEGDSAVIISRPGASISEAKEEVQNYSSSESLYFAQSEFVLFGEAAAQTTLEEYLDYLARSAEIRMDASLFVLKGGDAETLIINSADAGVDVTENLSSIARNTRRQGTAFAFSGRETASSLAEYGGALICAVSPPEGGGEDSADESQKVLSGAGYGILSQGKLCGYLDEEAAWGANILLNKTGFTSLSLKLENGPEVSLFSVTGSTAYSAEWDEAGGLRRVVADISVEGHIVETSHTVTDDDEEWFRNAVTAALEAKLKSRCLEVLGRSQSLETDFLGLLGVMRKQYPAKIYTLEGAFATALSKAEIEVNVTATVHRSYDVEGVPQILDGGISK